MSDQWNVLAVVVEKALDKVVLEKGEIDKAARSQDYFHPSSVGECARKIVMDRLEVPRPPFSPQTQRIFENGHAVHARIQKELEQSGILVKEEYSLSSPEHNMGGHTDGVGCIQVPELGGCMAILEIKSCGQKSWDWMIGKVRFKGHGPDKKHIEQVQLYMYCTGIVYAVIIYENKNTQQRAYFVIKKDAETISRLLAKVDMVNAHVEAKTLPLRDEEHQIVGQHVPFECEYCLVRAVCEKEEEIMKGQIKKEAAHIDLLQLGRELLVS